ncbi:hypothetical protein F66182_1365 [Fusarium sp. NRRL 66182]|nr:hypothetical protein F66182_1365 [Fusarium sp. NRRL 66182]
MGENNIVQMPGSDPSQDGPSGIRASSASSGPRARLRTDRIQKLLETVLMTFRYDFQNLPPEAQQAYSRFEQNKSFPEFAAGLKRLLLNHRLDEFIKGSPGFLHAAVYLFADRYPQLRLQELLDEKESLRKTTLPKQGSDSSVQWTNLRRQAKVEARRNNQAKEFNGPPERKIPVHRRKRKIGKDFDDFAHVEASPLLPHSQATVGQLTTVPTNDDATGSSQAPEPERFMISTRTPVGTETPGDGKSRSELNKAWLRHYMETRGGPKPDFNLYPYKGWKIEQPKVLLHRARNFLADEDIDRALDWGQKFAELAEYFSYLLHHWQGEDWGAELHEVIDMLRTHWLFEQYHYGKPRLHVKFNNVWPKETKRLPHLQGAEVAIEKRQGSENDDMGERRLLLNQIRPAIDVHYKMPLGALQEHVRNYGSGASEFWPKTPVRFTPQSEMVNIENKTFEVCVSNGATKTLEAINHGEKLCERNDEAPHPGPLFNFAQLRGARRAALQQVLSCLDNAENFAVCNVWRTFILPPPKIPEKPDAGIIFPVTQVAKVPEKEARDPFSYTLAHNWYTREERYWAGWTREHAIEEAYGRKLWLGRNEPIMNLPHNFKGPYIHDHMDSDMQKSLALLRRCETLWKRIKIQDYTSGRSFLGHVIKSIDSGVENKPWDEMDVKFRREEFVSGSQALAHIRPKEEEFLQLLGERSYNTESFGRRQLLEDTKYDDPLFKLFAQRVDNILDAKGPDPYRLGHLDEFLEEINRDCDGPVKRWRFSKEITREALKALERDGKVELEDEDDGDIIVAYPSTTLHPEDRIGWSDVVKGMGNNPFDTDDYISKGTNDSMVEGVADKDEVETISTNVSDSKSKDLADYMLGLPKIENLRSWEQVINGQPVKEDKLKTLEFYKRLGFRLGKTIHDLRAKQTRIRRLTPEQRESNRMFLDDIVRFWEEDVLRRPNAPQKNPNKVGPMYYNPVTPKYRDIVKMAEPEAYDDDAWQAGIEGSHLDEKDDSREATIELVRKGILREAHENKSMLFPSRIGRRINEKGETVQLPRRREPVWSFAHPERRGKVPRYWDINRWPVHLQNKEKHNRLDYIKKSSGESEFSESSMRLSMREHKERNSSPVVSSLDISSDISSPEPSSPESTERIKSPKSATKPTAQPQQQAGASLTRSAQLAEEMDTAEDRTQIIPGLGEEFTVTFEDKVESRRTFRLGPAEYWLGDTPLQKKAVENYIRRGIESAPTPNWRQRLAALFGRKETEDDPTALPRVDPRDVPKSKPQKGSFEESDDQESAYEDISDIQEVGDEVITSQDIEMEGTIRRFPGESEADPSSGSVPKHLSSPLVPAFSPPCPAPSQPFEIPSSGLPSTLETPEIPKQTGTAETEAFRHLDIGQWSSWPPSQPLQSCRLRLEIEDPLLEPIPELSSDGEDKALHNALYGPD